MNWMRAKNTTAWNDVYARVNRMEKRITKKRKIPAFANEADEAKWWVIDEGPTFLKERYGDAPSEGGSKLVAKLADAKRVQIALRLSPADLTNAREVAEQKVETLLKMLVHKRLRRAERALHD